MLKDLCSELFECVGVCKTNEYADARGPPYSRHHLWTRESASIYSNQYRHDVEPWLAVSLSLSLYVSLSLFLSLHTRARAPFWDRIPKLLVKSSAFIRTQTRPALNLGNRFSGIICTFMSESFPPPSPPHSVAVANQHVSRQAPSPNVHPVEPQDLYAHTCSDNSFICLNGKIKGAE